MKNQDGIPVENATVTINAESKTTDSSGRALFYSKTGDVEYLASYLKGKQSGYIPISDDTEYEILLSQYFVTIDVIDDYGEPLPSTLEFLGETHELADGHFETDEVFGEEITAVVTYAGVVKEYTIYPAEKNDVDFVFDPNPSWLIDPGEGPARYQVIISTSYTYMTAILPDNPSTTWELGITIKNGKTAEFGAMAVFPGLKSSIMATLKVECDAGTLVVIP